MQKKCFFVPFLLIVFFSCSQLTTQLNDEVIDGAKNSNGQKNLKDFTLDLKVHKKVLKNGLKILVIENPILPIYSYYTFFDVGGRYESRENGTTGATHFLEHMMFKGGGKYGPHVFDSYIEKNGGSTNAYTTFDSTVYYESLPSHTLETIIDMEADRIENLALEETAFESERLVVLEERKLRYENSPRGQLWQALTQTMFKGTPYGGSVIGDESDVKNLTREQMRDFFKKFYTPDNAVIVIVGDVKASNIFKLVEEKFGKAQKASQEIQSYKEKMNDLKRFLAPKELPREVNIHGESPNPIFMMSYLAPPMGERKSYVLDVLASMIGGGDSSYLTQNLVKNKKPLLNGVSAGSYNLRYNGVFYIGGELLSGVSLKNFRKELDKKIATMCTESITERNLQKTKNQFLVGFYSGLEGNANLASFIGTHEHYFGDYKNYKKEVAIYDSINLEEVMNVCQELTKKQGVFMSVWNKHPVKSN